MPEKRRRTWPEFTWPEWVPAELRKHIEGFHSDAWGRGPDGWEESSRAPYNEGRPLGERVEARRLGGDGWVAGRFVHTWNNMAAVVLDDGSFECVGASGCLPPREAAVERYQDGVKACAQARAILLKHDLPRLLEEISKAETLGPVLDPTLYREKGKAMEEDRDLMRAALALRNFGEARRA